MPLPLLLSLMHQMAKEREPPLAPTERLVVSDQLRDILQLFTKDHKTCAVQLTTLPINVLYRAVVVEVGTEGER